MKATMIIDDKLGFSLKLEPETTVEETMLSAVNRGFDVGCHVYEGEMAHELMISGEGKRHVGTYEKTQEAK